ncbi:hypothetical protein SAMN04488518_101212 [Pseudovibrio ascidiaceicola]|uniref:Uncharacterized protein n=2 Tax=Pseudovibrio ascidiaceicola TaxID=285279 RepID=A0A1I3V679_9HYPH|nr:hypothetical protein SAMN04488518_101212 [Pseudovibrio ascidiaceicola]
MFSMIEERIDPQISELYKYSSSHEDYFINYGYNGHKDLILNKFFIVATSIPSLIIATFTLFFAGLIMYVGVSSLIFLYQSPEWSILIKTALILTVTGQIGIILRYILLYFPLTINDWSENTRLAILEQTNSDQHKNRLNEVFGEYNKNKFSLDKEIKKFELVHGTINKRT